MPEAKMKKCRLCGQDVLVDEEGKADFVHDCGWAESEAKRKLDSEDKLEEMRQERKKKSTPSRKSIFG